MNLNFCSKQKIPYQKLLAKNITKCSRRDILKNIKIANVTPLVTVISHPPRPDRVANLILKVNNCEDVLLDSIQRPKPFSIYRTNEERVCSPPSQDTYAMCL